MGDRAMVRFRDSHSVSPAVYLHWSGAEVPRLVADAAAIMRTRLDDANYACARFVFVCCEANGGWHDNLSVGVTDRFESHGDAGIFEVDVQTWPWKLKHMTMSGYAPDMQQLSIEQREALVLEAVDVL